ncbi:DUF19 domain-containing protein [Aphelenchoides besseyi]|nr:DUF19 domain-containing protein [Aphelenchoides besseyi]KAI6232558.1 DUF19 domain-containing protein [Aphelenchoides besseyi]
MYLKPTLQFLLFIPLAFASIVQTHDTSVDLTRDHCSRVTEQTISDCLSPILNYANSIQQTSTSNSPFSLQGGDVFKKLCTLYSAFKDCTRGINCHSISIEAVEASYGYMCGAGHSHFQKHAACFAEVESQREYQLCRDAASESMDDAVRSKTEDLDLYFQKLCRVMDDYLRCCRPFVVEKCGQDAWRLVSQITIDSLKVTMPSCDVNNALL